MRLVVGLLHHQRVTLSTSEPPSHVPVVTFFNNKGGVGKTSLVYHLSWMLKRIGRRVLAVDLDPQANLTSAFLTDERLERLWLADSDGEATTIYRSIIPLMEARPMKPPALVALGSSHHSNDYDIELEGRGPSGLALIPGDLELASFEEILNQEWPNALSSGSPVAYRANQVLSSLWSVIQRGARAMSADLVLADVGPSLGAINRAALIATDFVVVPLGADLFSLQGLRNLGKTLKTWSREWSVRVQNWSALDEKNRLALPSARMKPLGYVVQQHAVRLNRPVKAYDRWVRRIPGEYAVNLLGQTDAGSDRDPESDPNRIATLKHYRSLVPLAQDLRKPIFALTAADGAIGSHAVAVQQASEDFRVLALEILDRMSPEPERAPTLTAAS